VRVLIVDDNADMRDYLSRLLEARYEVRIAADGEQALELLCAGGADLVLSDVMMPGLDGFGLVRRIRAIESLAGTPVILLSARAGEEASVEGLETGADDYVVKPFSSRELFARVLLVVGDVAGHGLESAVVMGTMRAALRAYVLRDPSPDRLLEELNAFAYTLDRPAMVTCQCLLIDAEGRGLTYTTAGHPPGLIRSADGGVVLLEAPGAPPLGTQLLPRFPLTRVPLEMATRSCSTPTASSSAAARRSTPASTGSSRRSERRRTTMVTPRRRWPRRWSWRSARTAARRTMWRC
jgi:DNA-binding response OmpR family regulator